MSTARSDTRRRVLDVAAELLESAGREAVSTRAVAAAAGLQQPAIYRLFGDKDGLMESLAGHGFEKYLGEKHGLQLSDDPVEDLYRGWDLNVDFGLRHPEFYVLMYGTARPGRQSPAAREAAALLVKLLGRAADAGRLRVPAETAAPLVSAATVGVTLALLAEGDRSPDRSVADRMRDTVLGSVVTDPVPSRRESDTDVAARALALDAGLSTHGTAEGSVPPLNAAETALLRDWLQRLATA